MEPPGSLRLPLSPRAPAIREGLHASSPVHGGVNSNSTETTRRLASRSRHSPRQVKLQRVAPIPAPMPFHNYGTDNSSFRNDLFRFHQVLRDVVGSFSIDQCSSLAIQSAQDRELLRILTSDRGDAVLREIFRQMRLRTSKSSSSTANDDNMGAALWDVLETLFRNLPLVVPEHEANTDARAFYRYVDALKALRDVLIPLLFFGPGQQAINESYDFDDGQFSLDHKFNSGRSTIITPGKQQLQQQNSGSGSRERVPLFERCQHLEREIEKLQRRLAVAGIDDPITNGRRVREEDIGLLHEATETLLLEFWQLPRGERLGFFSQISSQLVDDDASAILKVFVENSSAQSFSCAWEALQGSPQFKDALKLELAALSESRQASSDNSTTIEAAATRNGSPTKSPVLNEGHDERSRRVSVRTPGRRGRPRGRDSRFIDLNGITEGFDELRDHSDESTSSGEGDEQNHREHHAIQLKKLGIRERGRTPPNASGASRKRKQKSHHTHHRHHDDTIELDDEDEDFRRGRKAPSNRIESGLTLAQKLHRDLIELIKEEYSPADREALHFPGILDAGWKLLEVLENHRGGNKSGYNRRNISLAPGATSELTSFRTNHDSEGDQRKPLTLEQQFLMQFDQLQATLGSISSTNVEEMDAIVITSVFRRLPALSKLFSVFSNNISEAAGSSSINVPETQQHPTTSSIAGHGLTGSPRRVSVMPGSAAASSLTSEAQDPASIDADAVAELLGKFSKFVRSLVPVIELSEAGDGSSSNALAIMKLADEMEMVDIPHAEDPSPSSSTIAAVVSATSAASTAATAARRRSTIEYHRRLEIMRRLRSLVVSNDFDNVAAAITSTVNDVIQEREALITSISDSKPRSKPRPVIHEDEQYNGGEGLDEVIRMAKSAKTRRASDKAIVAKNVKDEATEDEDEEEEELAGRGNPRDIPINLRHANAAKGIKLFSIGILLRVIDQLYRDNFECTVSTLQYGNRRMDFSEFMYDWHIRKYGLKALAQRHLLKFIQSLRKYERKAFQCQLCLRFLGIQSPLGYHEHKFVLGLLDRWSLGTFSGTTRHRVALSKQQFKIRVSYAVSTVQEALNERFGLYFRSAESVAQRIRALVIPGDDEFVKENELLALAVDEYVQQRDRISQVLQAVYTAGDLNGDGSLEFDEFAAVLGHLAPGADDMFVQKVFAAAHDHVKPRRISFERFMDVILLERILNTASISTTSSASSTTNGTSSSKNTSTMSTSGRGSASSTPDDRRGAVQLASGLPTVGASSLEEEEAYQFKLLQETWSNDRDTVMAVLKNGIPHAPTAASLSFRVAFLDQLLARRVDAKTAWLCHRHIMREIGRYQNLNADEIVVLKTKEERFKKAVLAIRNMQMLGAQFLQLAAAKRVGTGPTETSPSEENATETQSYTSVVDKTLAEEEQYVDGDGQTQVMALENQLRLRFVEQADERAIDDYINAMHRLRRSSVFASPPKAEMEALSTVDEGDNDGEYQDGDLELEEDGNGEEDMEPDDSM